jgi:hypothetical protein
MIVDKKSQRGIIYYNAIKRGGSMENNEGRERLTREIDQLTEEDRSYVLGVSQALVFAQEAMNKLENTFPLGNDTEGKDGYTGLF